MRIIAGTRRGHKLLSPINGGKVTEVGDVNATRPTLDRVKEAMFSIINMKIYDSVVLDIFTGTGSLGLECASRGAREVILVDSYKETYDLLVENIRNLRFNKECKSYNMDYKKALEKFIKEKRIFNIIFIDPPYLNNMIPPVIDLVEEHGLLGEDGIIVTKVDKSEKIYQGAGDLKFFRERKYGNTVLAFYQWMKEEK